MPEQPVAPGVSAPSLTEHLQRVTEALAAATTPAEVFTVVLEPALQALNAIAGAVLLVNEAGDQLRMTATRGHEEGAETIWQDGPLSADVPSGAALERHEALFYEHAGALARAYPQLEARTGVIAPVASVVLPMFGDARPLGVVVLDFHEPHHFTDEERRFLCTLAAQCGIALGRARLLARVQREAREKSHILESISDAFYAVDHAWRFTYVNGEAERLWGRRREDLLGKVIWDEFVTARNSPPHHAHLEALRERRVVRLESVSPIVGRWVDISIYPTQDGLAVYFKDISARKQQEQELQALNAELESRVAERTRVIQGNARAQEAFVAFANAVGTEVDVLVLARQAVQVVRANLEDVSVAYYELEGGRWTARVWSDDIPAEIVAQIRGGVAQDAPQYAQAARTRAAVFADGWSASANGVAHAEAYGAAAFLPLVVNGETRSLFSVGTRLTRAWTEHERAVIQAVMRGLSIAMERAEQTRSLADRNAKLGARTRALGAFQEWTHDLTLTTEASALMERAEALLFDLLPIQAVVFYERIGERWFVKSMRGGFGSEGLRLAHEAGLPHEDTHNLRIPFETGEAHYQDVYHPETDGLAAHMTHVSATAIVPLRTGRGIRNLMGVARFGQVNWTGAERTIIETVWRSLELALDRAEQAADLQRERAALSARSSELARTNEELEAFTYSVSHDLRTPVRHIVGFTELLGSSLKGRLDDREARYLKVIRDATARMNTLIDAMLDLSRTARLPLRLGPVDLGAVVAGVRAELEPDADGRAVRWVVAPLPVVMGDRDTLRQVVVNLLSNALKFTLPRAEAVIEVWAEEREQDWLVCVRDNGVGFNAQYTDRLFGVFQRLHRQEDFEGTGVGLANVRRIIARHGGEASARSGPGEGATFAFTLPKSAGGQ